MIRTQDWIEDWISTYPCSVSVCQGLRNYFEIVCVCVGGGGGALVTWYWVRVARHFLTNSSRVEKKYPGWFPNTSTCSPPPPRSAVPACAPLYGWPLSLLFWISWGNGPEFSYCIVNADSLCSGVTLLTCLNTSEMELLDCLCLRKPAFRVLSVSWMCISRYHLPISPTSNHVDGTTDVSGFQWILWLITQVLFGGKLYWQMAKQFCRKNAYQP